MMKIGILTFHDALNYGAVLQAYALQSYLAQSTKADVEIIDYKPNNRPAFTSSAYKASNSVKQIVGDIILAYYCRALKKRDSRFRQFASEHHKLSKRCYSSLIDFERYCREYSVLVAGSDQIFNPKPDSKIYYLGFNAGECRRIAYAPSIGLSKLTPNQTEIIKPWINNFDALSCRESQGAKILSGISGKEVPVVCDPVCLISKEQWERVAKRPDYSNFIFVFDLNGGKPLVHLALKLKEQTGLPIVYSSLKAIHPFTHSCKIKHDLGPKEWLGHIMNASYVVTDSFHGTMLSLILKTPVFNKIASVGTSSRITSIMELLGIIDQLINDASAFELKSIKFNDYSKKLADFITYSKEYLSTAIKGAK